MVTRAAAPVSNLAVGNPGDTSLLGQVQGTSQEDNMAMDEGNFVVDMQAVAGCTHQQVWEQELHLIRRALHQLEEEMSAMGHMVASMAEDCASQQEVESVQEGLRDSLQAQKSISAEIASLTRALTTLSVAVRQCQGQITALQACPKQSSSTVDPLLPPPSLSLTEESVERMQELQQLQQQGPLPQHHPVGYQEHLPQHHPVGSQQDHLPQHHPMGDEQGLLLQQQGTQHPGQASQEQCQRPLQQHPQTAVPTCHPPGYQGQHTELLVPPASGLHNPQSVPVQGLLEQPNQHVTGNLQSTGQQQSGQQQPMGYGLPTQTSARQHQPPVGYGQPMQQGQQQCQPPVGYGQPMQQGQQQCQPPVGHGQPVQQSQQQCHQPVGYNQYMQQGQQQYQQHMGHGQPPHQQYQPPLGYGQSPTQGTSVGDQLVVPYMPAQGSQFHPGTTPVADLTVLRSSPSWTRNRKEGLEDAFRDPLGSLKRQQASGQLPPSLGRAHQQPGEDEWSPPMPQRILFGGGEVAGYGDTPGSATDMSAGTPEAHINAISGNRYGHSGHSGGGFSGKSWPSRGGLTVMAGSTAEKELAEAAGAVKVPHFNDNPLHLQQSFDEWDAYSYAHCINMSLQQADSWKFNILPSRLEHSLGNELRDLMRDGLISSVKEAEQWLVQQCNLDVPLFMKQR